MELKKFRISIKIQAELVHEKEFLLPDREAAEDYADYILKNEIFDDWEFEIFETSGPSCRIYDIK